MLYCGRSVGTLYTGGEKRLQEGWAHTRNAQRPATEHMKDGLRLTIIDIK
jgi:hypothetical protein